MPSADEGSLEVWFSTRLGSTSKSGTAGLKESIDTKSKESTARRYRSLKVEMPRKSPPSPSMDSHA